MATTGNRKDPYRGFNFRVEIDNITVGAFSDVSGLSSDGDTVEFCDAARQLHIRKLTGLRKFSNARSPHGIGPILNRLRGICLDVSSCGPNAH
jgi:hypothetical protein